MNHRIVCAAALAFVALAGCFADKRVIDSQRDAAADSGLPLPPPGVCKRAKQCLQLEQGTDKVDLLFMIDNSNSMREEQAALLQQIPALIAALSSGDIDQDGTPEFGEVRDLHLGVVSSDMGVPGVTGVDNCSGFGDDGLLQHTPSPALPSCQKSYPPFIAYEATGTVSIAETARDFTCIATLGTGGCGFEQQLEAPLKALWPSRDPLPKVDGSPPGFLADAMGHGGRGHGDSDNDGFLRSDSEVGWFGARRDRDQRRGRRFERRHPSPDAVDVSRPK